MKREGTDGKGETQGKGEHRARGGNRRTEYGMEVNQASFLTSLVSLRYYLVAGWSRLVARWAQCRRKHDPLIAAETRNESYGGLCRRKLLYDHLSNSGKPVAG